MFAGEGKGLGGVGIAACPVHLKLLKHATCFLKKCGLVRREDHKATLGGKRYDSPLINGYTFGYAIGLPYPYNLNISLYSKMLACIYSKFALLEPSRTVKKMAGFVRKITGDNVEGVCTHQGFQTHTGTPSLTFLSSLFIDFRGLHRN